MSEKKKFDMRLVKVGELLKEKRLALGPQFKKREDFVEDRGVNLFNHEDWISSRYLASLELGHNQIGIEKLIKLAYALEVDPVELFADILHIYQNTDQ